MSATPYISIWEYRVRMETEKDFLVYYTSDGVWTQLFRRGPGYLGTELYRDREQRDRFITIDRWRDEATFRAFRAQFAAEFEALDHLCAGFTTRETQLGEFLLMGGSITERPGT